MIPASFFLSTAFLIHNKVMMTDRGRLHPDPSKTTRCCYGVYDKISLYNKYPISESALLCTREWGFIQQKKKLNSDETTTSTDRNTKREQEPYFLHISCVTL